MNVEQKIHLKKSHDRIRGAVDQWLSSVASERVTVESSHGSLRQAGFIYFADKPSRSWVILVHPYRMSHVFMQKHALLYAASGFNVLAIDLVGCGESEGDVMRMGADDALDVLRWARYLVHRFGTDIDIVLHGCSLGASAVLAASGRCAIPQVGAVIAESGFDTLPHIVTHVVNVVAPHMGFLAEKLFAGCAKQMYHMDVDKNSALPYVSSSQIPTLFLHAEDDRVITSDMLDNLYECCSAPLKRIHRFPGVGHLEAFDDDPKGYMDVVNGFLREVDAARKANHIATKDKNAE